MSDNITRYQVEENDTNIVKYQVQDNTNNDKLIRHQVMGIGSAPAPTPVYDTLTATDNGTYYPGEGVDAFDEIIVDVPAVLPERELLFDLRVEEGVLKDIIGNTPLRTNAITISDGMFSGSSGSAYVRTDFAFNPCEKYEIKIKCGDYSNLDYGSLADLAILLSFGANANSHIGIRAHKENGNWYFSNGSTSSNDVLISDDFYFFSDTEQTIKVEAQDSPYLHQVLKLNNVNSGADMMYSNEFLQVYSAAYNWIASAIPIEYIQIYKINN